jgi:hypothetical protein
MLHVLADLFTTTTNFFSTPTSPNRTSPNLLGPAAAVGTVGVGGTLVYGRSVNNQANALFVSINTFIATHQHEIGREGPHVFEVIHKLGEGPAEEFAEHMSKAGTTALSALTAPLVRRKVSAKLEKQGGAS